MKAIEHYFRVVLLIMLYMVVQTFKAVISTFMVSGKGELVEMFGAGPWAVRFLKLFSWFTIFDRWRPIPEPLQFILYHSTDLSNRSIESSLWAFASMWAVSLFLRAWTVINFPLRAQSTLKITNGEQSALHKFSASWNLSFIKTLFCAK